MSSATRTLEELRSKTAGSSTSLVDAPRPRRTLQELLNDPKVKQGLTAVAGKTLSPERVAKLVTGAVYRTPALALCNPTTVLGALMASVSLGLEPNTPAGHAYLIPFKRSQPRKDARGVIETDAQGKWIWDETYECQFQLGYRGLIVLGYRSPRVHVIDAEAIHRNDQFTYQKGSGSFLHWSLPLDLAADRGSLIGAYCHVAMKDAGESFTVLQLQDIHRVRERSETYTTLVKRAAEARQKFEAASGRERDKAAKDLAKAEKTLADTPWVQWEDGMAIKTAIKRHVSQRMPLDPGDWLQLGVDLDNSSERGVLDMAVFADPDAAHALAVDGSIPHEALKHDGDDADEEEQPEPAQAESEPHGATTQAEPARTAAANPPPLEAGAEDPDKARGGAARKAAAKKTAPPALDLE